jgi:trigger factor
MPKKTITPTAQTTEKTEAKKDTPAPSLIAPNTKITITIPWEKAQPAYTKARNKVASTVKIAGFRKGKVPADVAEKMLGAEQIIEKALEELLPDAYIEAIKQADKKPLTQPSFQAVSLQVGQEWVVEAQIAERPMITLGDYKKTVAEAKKAAKKEVETREAEIKKATEQGEPGHEGHDHTPKPLTDEQKKELTLQHIYQALLEAIKPQIPELLVRHEVEYDLDQLGRQLQAIQMTFEQYLQRRGVSQEILTQQMAMSALGRIQLVFVIDAIAAETKLEVSDVEVTKYIDEKVDPSVKAQYGTSPEYTNMLRQTLLRQKVADSLLAI